MKIHGVLTRRLETHTLYNDYDVLVIAGYTVYINVKTFALEIERLTCGDVVNCVVDEEMIITSLE